MTRWRKIKGFENYSVSDRGRVRNDKTYELVRQYPYNLYAKVNLRKDGKTKLVFVHRLVAKAFIPNPENKPEVNHKNGIRYDNRVENLEWVTHKENMHHAVHVLGRQFGRPKGGLW